MQQLNVKTRFDLNKENVWKLKEKQNVYFCCHPDDFKLYFETLSDEILKEVDCAIWYQQEEDKLSSMVLFVVPITHNLLLKKSQADDEIKYAFKNKYAVLPILVESDIDPKLYEKKFGAAQYLDKTKREDTGKPYEEKFKNFLNSILIGDELAEKVRKAFDAYIFLSYRKKDRKYAEELMHLIHKNDFCRDIAIWYDENLIPGEAFNKGIKAAMKKSSLFLLAVTPNLIIERNYVKTKEYPMARRNKMPILPAELVPTDKKELSKQYKKIPIPVDPRNQEELENGLKSTLPKELLEKLEAIETTSNDTDPEHNYLIGLAYLNSIDVERNNEKALNLITSAANNNLIEACKKLVSMYKSAEGVERNFDEAILWQKKICDIYKQKLAEEETLSNRIKYFNALWNYGTEYENFEKLNNAENIYNELLVFALETDKIYKNNTCKRGLSISYSNLGNISKAQGYLPQALKYYKNGLEIREQLAKETNTTQSREDLSISYSKLGGISEAQGDLPQALEYYNKCLEIRDKLAKENMDIESRHNLSVCYGKLGEISEEQKNLPQALEYYKKYFEISKQLAKETRTPQSRRDLSISYNKLGDISKAQGDLPQASEYYKKSLEISEQIEKETGTIESRRDLSISYNKLGDIIKAQGDLPQALEYYNKSFVIFESLVKETGTIKARRDLSVGYNNLGDISEAQGDLPQALEYYQKSFEINEQLVKETGTIESRRDLSVSYEKLGDIRKAQGSLKNLEQALEYYKKDLEISEQLAKETGTRESRRDLSISYNKLGGIYEVQSNFKNLEQALDYYKKSFEIREQLAKETGTVESRRDLSVGYENLGDISKAQGDFSQALKYYSKYFEMSEQLAKETGTIELKRDLSISYIKLGGIYEVQSNFKNLEQALDYYNKSLEIFEQLANKLKTISAYKDLMIGLTCVGNILELQKNIVDANKYFEKAYKIYKMINK